MSQFYNNTMDYLLERMKIDNTLHYDSESCNNVLKNFFHTMLPIVDESLRNEKNNVIVFVNTELSKILNESMLSWSQNMNAVASPVFFYIEENKMKSWRNNASYDSFMNDHVKNKFNIALLCTSYASNINGLNCRFAVICPKFIDDYIFVPRSHRS